MRAGPSKKFPIAETKGCDPAAGFHNHTNATTSASMTTPAPENGPQPHLPFDGRELLRVRVRPADLARMLGVNKSTITRWIQRDVITLGCDGRLDPERAMREILRRADPGQTRARLVRRAFGDLGDLRERAAQAAVLEERLRDLQRQAEAAAFAAAEDYETLQDWLERFEKSIADIPRRARAEMDALEWRGHVRDLMLRVMDDGHTAFEELDRQIEASMDSALASLEGGGAA